MNGKEEKVDLKYGKDGRAQFTINLTEKIKGIDPSSIKDNPLTLQFQSKEGKYYIVKSRERKFWSVNLDLDKLQGKYQFKFVARPQGPAGKDGKVVVIKGLTPVNESLAVNNLTLKGSNYNKAYMFGYLDGTVNPNIQITRAEAAAMIARLQELDLSDLNTPKYSYTPSAWYNSVINAVVNSGIMKGYPDGTFKPNQKITRAEFAQILANLNKTVNGVAPFADIKGHWLKKVIDAVYAKGEKNGYPDKTFKPNDKITRSETTKMLNNGYDRIVDEYRLKDVKKDKDFRLFQDNVKGQWYYYDIIEATNDQEYLIVNKDNKNLEKWTDIIRVID